MRVHLDASLQKLAGLNLVLVGVGIDAARLAQKVGKLSQLVNEKKLSKII